jgi:hypothetical protein
MDNNNNGNWNTGMPNMGAQPPINAPLKLYDPVKKANMALIFGLISIVSWIIPLAGIVTSCIGITCGMTGLKSSKHGRALAGFVLSIIFLVVSILSWILSAAFNIFDIFNR